MKNDKKEYVDFGAPSAFGAHLFKVEIPTARKGAVIIVEDFGYKGEEDDIPKEEERVVLDRERWSAISDVVKREFNDRLKNAKLSTARWHTGDNLMDRLLGKELCVLAWAVEEAPAESIDTIISKWSALRPEERWWLFSMTVAETGLTEDKGKGWRKALFSALSYDQKKQNKKRRRRPKENDMYVLPLFGNKESM